MRPRLIIQVARTLVSAVTTLTRSCPHHVARFLGQLYSAISALLSAAAALHAQQADHGGAGAELFELLEVLLQSLDAFVSGASLDAGATEQVCSVALEYIKVRALPAHTRSLV